MAKSFVIPIFFILGLFSMSTAQEESAYLRIMQLSYDQQGDEPTTSTVDISIDGELAFENIPYPFTTEYLSLNPGTHTIETAMTENDTAFASTEIELEAGQRYTMIANGNYSEGGVKYVIVSEYDLLVNERGHAVILVNQFTEPINVYFDGALVAENLNPDDYTFITPPLEEFTAELTASSDPDTILASIERTILPNNTTFLAVISGSSAEDIYPFFHRSSEMAIAEYLQSQVGTAPFGSAAELIQTAGLLDALTDADRYTLFLPSNSFLDRLPEGMIPTDPTALQGILMNHVASVHLPPYELVGTEQLTMLSGNNAALQFIETESSLWEIAGTPIVWEVRLANGVIYLVNGIILLQ